MTTIGEGVPRGPKLVLVPGPSPWRGVVYTTRHGRRRTYSNQGELLSAIAELTGWTATPESSRRATP